MLKNTKPFSGFAVKDLEEAKGFYGDTLGLDVNVLDPENGLLEIEVEGERNVLVYRKDDHAPANYTILNFPVENVEATVDELAGRGVEFERYEGTELETDEKGIFRGGGPLIAWFTDPAGNILSVLQQD